MQTPAWQKGGQSGLQEVDGEIWEKGRRGRRSRKKMRRKRRTPSSWSQKAQLAKVRGGHEEEAEEDEEEGPGRGTGKCLVDAVLGLVGLGQRVQLGPEASRLWAWSPKIAVLGAAALHFPTLTHG